MEENNKQIEEQAPVPKIGSGAMLASARKELGKSVEEIADELNLSVSQIRTIELDQSEGLPEPTYVRGYIRSYARLVGLNAEEVLLHYQNRNWQKSPNLDEIPRGITEGDHSSGGGFFSAGKLITLLMVAGIVGFFFFADELSSVFNSEQATEVASTLSNSSAVTTSETSQPLDSEVTPQNSEAQGEVADESSQVLEVADVDAGPSDINASESTEATQVEPVPQNDETRVRLTFTETSWVDIRDEAQNKLAYQSFPEGKVLDVGAKGVLSVLIGNAKGVQMQVNGQPYDLSQHTKGVYAKFSVGRPAQ